MLAVILARMLSQYGHAISSMFHGLLQPALSCVMAQMGLLDVQSAAVLTVDTKPLTYMQRWTNQSR